MDREDLKKKLEETETALEYANMLNQRLIQALTEIRENLILVDAPNETYGPIDDSLRIISEVLKDV